MIFAKTFCTSVFDEIYSLQFQQVDQRKLDKAEAKIQKKLEKRSQPESSSRPEAPRYGETLVHGFI